MRFWRWSLVSIVDMVSGGDLEPHVKPVEINVNVTESIRHNAPITLISLEPRGRLRIQRTK